MSASARPMVVTWLVMVVFGLKRMPAPSSPRIQRHPGVLLPTAVTEMEPKRSGVSLDGLYLADGGRFARSATSGGAF